MKIGLGCPGGSPPGALIDLLAAVGLPAAALAGLRAPMLREDGDTVWLLGAEGDVATACRRGALDAGVVGKDLLLERGSDLHELLDLGVGRDALVHAVAAAAPAARGRRVATRYPRLTARHFGAAGRPVEVVAFEEPALAVSLGLAGGVVELRSRLAGGGLEEREELAACGARLVAGRAAHALRAGALADLVERLRARLEG